MYSSQGNNECWQCSWLYEALQDFQILVTLQSALGITLYIENLDVCCLIYIYIYFIRTKYNDKGALHRECRFWEKKESDKQIIHHKSTRHVPYISITGFTSLLSNKQHAHSIRPGILTTAKVLNYWGYLTICKTTEFRDSIPGINEFTDLPGIVKQIRELTDALCGRSDLIRVRFTDVRGHLYSGTVAAQGSNSVPGCAFTNEKYMHIFRRGKSIKKFIHAPGMLVLEGKRIYNMWQESGMGSVWDLKGPFDRLIPLNIELTHMLTIHVPRLRPIPGTTCL